MPIFMNVEIRRSEVGEHMHTFAEQHNIITTPDAFLLGTPLLKFSLDVRVGGDSYAPSGPVALPPLAFCRLCVNVASRRQC